VTFSFGVSGCFSTNSAVETEPDIDGFSGEEETMPTVLIEGPYRFFWYSVDRAEPPHVHVDEMRIRRSFGSRLGNYE
jgi:hypothetical protein